MAGLKAPKVKTVVTKDPEELKEKENTRQYFCCGCCGNCDSEEDDQEQGHENGPRFDGMSSENHSDSYSDKDVEDSKDHSLAKSNSEKGSSSQKTEQDKSSPPKDSSEPQDTLKHLTNDVKGEVTKKISPDQGDATSKDKKACMDGKILDDDFPEEVVRRNTLTNSGRLDIDNIKALAKDIKSDDGAKEDGKKPESTDDELSSDPSDIKEKVDIEKNDKKDTILFKDKRKEKDAEAKKSEEGEKGGLGLLTLLKKKLSKSDEKRDEKTEDDGSEMIISKDTLQLDKKDKTKAEDAGASEGKDSEKDSKPKPKSFLDFLKFKGKNNQ